MTVVYGLKNCDTCKKAIQWLSSKGINFEFKDIKIEGSQQQQVNLWLKKVDFTVLVNKRSTTWRNLDESAKNINDSTDALNVLTANPTLIKRPVIEHNKKIIVGFNASNYESEFINESS